MKSWLARQAYSLVLRLGTPAYLWRVWARGKEEPDYRANWPQRLGFYGPAYRALLAKQDARPVCWVHAVSLGEARAATPLIQAMRVQCPNMRLLLTHTTATGREAGKALLQEGDLQTWLPYDTPGAVRRFLRVHRPQVGVLMETEVWPNVQHEAARLGVPMVLANARLSEKSLKQGMRLAALMQPAARLLTLALAQTEDDARRLRTMGAHDVKVCGNVKFDMSPAPQSLALGRCWREASTRPVVLAASTREGEEVGLLDAWQSMRAACTAGEPVPRLLLVPRHPQRFDEVAALVAARGFIVSRRSTWADGQPDQADLAADVWLGDSMGEMPAYYATARVALLGGSFAPLGGQNLIEAAACGCPIVMGPSTFNFAEAAELSEQAGAAVRVSDWTQGVRVACELLASGQDAGMSERALTFAASHRGAAARMAQWISQCAQGSR